MNNTTICLVDDHALLRNGLATLVTNFGYTVAMECSNGREFVDQINKDSLPDLVLMDINMKEMDGYETTLWLKNNHPQVNVIALSMYDDENAILRMIKNGAKGYILKDASPQELKQALDSVVAHGFYYSDKVTGRVIRKITEDDNEEKLSEKEIEFLKLAASEMTYKEIAQKMHLSPRTIDGYRDQLFEKLNVRSRVGLVMYGIKKGYIHID